jgi:hypothetical protein
MGRSAVQIPSRSSTKRTKRHFCPTCGQVKPKYREDEFVGVDWTPRIDPFDFWESPPRESDSKIVAFFKQEAFQLPQALFHAFLVVAVQRLERSKGGAAVADQLLEHYSRFRLSLASVRAAHEDVKDFVGRAFAEREAWKPRRGPRSKLGDVLKTLLMLRYPQVLEAVSLAQTSSKDMRRSLREILDTLGPAGKQVQITDAMVSNAAKRKPWIVAEDLMSLVSGASLRALRSRDFPSRRRSASVLDRWIEIRARE